MPKISGPPPKRQHANSESMNDRFLRGHWMNSRFTVECCNTVSCPRCRANKTWPCVSAAGNVSSTAHGARWEAFHAAQTADAGGA